jgi:hypothetical protein
MGGAGLKVGLGGAWFWRSLYRAGLVRPPMPQWRVVVEARPVRPRRTPLGEVIGGVVVGVIVWAEDVEEAEALARIAVEADGLGAMTADGVRIAPQTRPAKESGAVARTPYALYPEEGAPEPRSTKRRAS